MGNNVRKKYICSLSSFELLKVCFRIFTSSALLGLLQSTSFYNPPYFLTYPALSFICLVYCTRELRFLFQLASYPSFLIPTIPCLSFYVQSQCWCSFVLATHFNYRKKLQKTRPQPGVQTRRAQPFSSLCQGRCMSLQTALDFLGVFQGIKGQESRTRASSTTVKRQVLQPRLLLRQKNVIWKPHLRFLLKGGYLQHSPRGIALIFLCLIPQL